MVCVPENLTYYCNVNVMYIYILHTITNLLCTNTLIHYSFVVLIYSLKGKDTKSIPCEILKDEMLLLERNWTRLIESNDSKSCQNEHLCLYELWEDDTAEQVKINCNSSFVRGIVLVNDNGKVDDTFWQGKNDIDVPVCIVSKVSCEDLLDQVGPDSRVNKNSKGPKNSTGPIVKVSATEGGKYIHIFFNEK